MPTSTNDRNRIDRLERMVFLLAEALTRQGTDVDGNWGHPASKTVFDQVSAEMNINLLNKTDGDG